MFYKPNQVTSVLPIDERPIDHTRLKGINFVIDTTWDGQPVSHEPISCRMSWNFEKQAQHKRLVKISFEAPLHDDPEAPEEFSGICPGLSNYEVMEFFFANSRNQYLQVQVGPYGHWLCILHDGYRSVFNNGEELELSVENVFKGDTWHCSFDLPIAYLPSKANKFNAYSVYGTPPNRIYEALYPVTDGHETEPDTHKLKYFRSIDLRRIIPDGFQAEQHNDPKYGDLWGENAGS